MNPRFLLFPLLACVWVRPASATLVDATNFTEALWTRVGGNATGMAWAPDGSNRLFAIIQAGQVLIVNWGTPPTVVTTPFATIQPIHAFSEAGLVGMAFDPNFQVNQYVYFFVTVNAAEQQIIRYTASGDVGTNKTVIKSALPTAGANHNGGGVGFGPDGKLYWAVGDNGLNLGVNADLSSLGAKIGRANPDGTIPADNPFHDGDGPNNDYVWARGLRNPFTFTMQPATGALWVNVVGASYEQVFIMNKADHAGWTNYENNQPAGFITPIIKYRTNNVDTRTISDGGAVRTGNVVTFTTTVAHGFRQGEKITIAGVADASFNGDVYVGSVPTETSFTVTLPQTAASATSGGGTAATLPVGGCVTGGTFYEATQFGPTYRGNFFFGDCNSGRVMRAVVGAGNTITSVDYWSSAIAAAIDATVGPDGALYYNGLPGEIYRTTFNASAQGLVVSGIHVWMAEGGKTSVSVSLAIAPAADVIVTAARAAGDTDVSVAVGGALTFTTTNWNVPQPVTVSAAHDLDATRDSATVSVSAAGLPPVSVTVNAVDDETNSFVISPSVLGINEGSSGTFTVALSEKPAAPVSVTVAPGGDDADIRVTSPLSLTFDAANYATPQTVTIAAAADSDSAEDAATILISAPGLATRAVIVTAMEPRPDASAGDASVDRTGDVGLRPDGSSNQDARGPERQATSGAAGCGCAAAGQRREGVGWSWMSLLSTLLLTLALPLRRSARAVSSAAGGLSAALRSAGRLRGTRVGGVREHRRRPPSSTPAP
jgi:glucose/arabinose dehydrogenase